MNTTTVWCDVKHCSYAEESDGTGMYYCTKEIIGLHNGVCEDYETDKLCINCLILPSIAISIKKRYNR